MSTKWAKGYAPEDIRRAQEKYGLVFPPDLVALLLKKRPAFGYDWRYDDAAIRRALAWPTDGLIFDVEHNALWLPEWGLRPDAVEARTMIVRAAVESAPKLVPLLGHRYLPAEPCVAGNPVFSVYQSDIIYYGADLDAYFNIELCLGEAQRYVGARRIRFWSDLVDRNEPDGLTIKGLDAGPDKGRPPG